MTREEFIDLMIGRFTAVMKDMPPFDMIEQCPDDVNKFIGRCGEEYYFIFLTGENVIRFHKCRRAEVGETGEVTVCQ